MKASPGPKMRIIHLQNVFWQRGGGGDNSFVFLIFN